MLSSVALLLCPPVSPPCRQTVELGRCMTYVEGYTPPHEGGSSSSRSNKGGGHKWEPQKRGLPPPHQNQVMWDSLKLLLLFFFFFFARCGQQAAPAGDRLLLLRTDFLFRPPAKWTVSPSDTYKQPTRGEEEEEETFRAFWSNILGR